ncbi:MAG: Ig-like domain-containing protein [Gemmatimonadetes bacterium]|nr:Ig-like domain-containing protein [Gemmatimonadota bacterium]
MRRVSWLVLGVLAFVAWNCSGGDDGTAPPVPTQVSKVSGDGQTGRVAAGLTDSLVVRVTGAGGAAVGGVTVTWSVTAGGGSVSPASTTTNSSGQAKTSWTLGTVVGPNAVSASVSGLTPVSFAATGTPGPAATVAKLKGDGQSATVSAAVTDSLTVKVTDAFGNSVSGVTVAWAVSAGGGAVSPTSATTDANGQAQTRWTLGTTIGANTATATVSGLLAASFSATALAGAAASVAKVSGDAQSATVGTAVADSLVVKVTDAFGNAVAGANVGWAVTAGGGSVAPASSTANSSGQAKTRWTLGTTAGTNAATATVTGLAAVSFSATGLAGAPASLTKVSGDAQSGNVGSALADSLVVKASDAHGNGVSGVSVSWAVTAGGGSVSPSSSATSSSGQAKTRWTLGPERGTNTATASASGLTAVSFTATAATLNLRIEAMYLTQSAQTRSGSVPLVKDRDGYLRVFVTASESNTVAPTVRVRFYSSGNLVDTRTISAPGASVPTSVSEEPLTTSWNVAVPASLIQPNLSILADVDPANTVSETNETDNNFPTSGTPLAMDVRTAATFSVRFVPVANGNLTGDVSTTNKARFIDFAQKIFPLPGNDTDVRAVYSTNQPPLQANDANGAWGRLIDEIEALRVAEGTSRFYYGVVKVSYSAGVAGVGFVPGRTSLGWDFLDTGDAAGVAAHEWGHNFNRGHAPCGDPSTVDSLYPYAAARIGIFGVDVATTTLKPDTMKDVMSYCDPQWISDYTYRGVLDYRAANPAPPDASGAAAGAAQPTLLIWGRVGRNGLEIEPAFEVTTRPVLPPAPGPYTLEGLDAGGRRLFSLSFRGTRVADLPGSARRFVFAVPAGMARPDQLAALRLSGEGMQVLAESATAAPAAPGVPAGVPPGLSLARPRPGLVEVRWNEQAYPMVMVRDAGTSEILSFARGGAVQVRSDAPELELVFSDGVRSFGLRARLQP